MTAFAKIAHNLDIGDFDNDSISIHGIKDLGKLFGQDFTMDEWLIITKECLEEGSTDLISYEKFTDYIEKMNEEIKIDPYNLIKELLTEKGEDQRKFEFYRGGVNFFLEDEDNGLVSLDGDVSLRKLR